MATIAEARANPAKAVPDGRGREADTPGEIPARGWKDIAVRTWKETSKDNMSLVAAGVAFYGFLAMIPMLGATVLTYGIVASPETVLQNVQSLAKTLPEDAAQLIGEQLLNVVKSSGGKKGLGLAAALAVALWGARNAAGSIVIALNIAYEEEEKRGFIKVTLLSLAITAAAVVLGLVGVAIVGILARLEHLMPSLGQVGVVGGKVVAYVVLAFLAAGAAATLYRYGPSRERAKWTWITPGTMLFGIGWVALTIGFGFYVSHFGSYNLTYGSLGGVVVLVTWMYLSSFILLFGAEFNSEVEHQTARDTTANAGEQPIGARGAWSADHVAGQEDQAEHASDKPRGVQASDEADGDGRGHVRAAGVPPSPRPAGDHPYIVARLANRAGRLAGLQKVGLFSAALSTIGLSMLRKRGSQGAGAALLAGAVGISLLRRED